MTPCTVPLAVERHRRPPARFLVATETSLSRMLNWSLISSRIMAQIQGANRKRSCEGFFLIKVRLSH
jgi:hypothetical protein